MRSTPWLDGLDSSVAVARRWIRDEMSDVDGGTDSEDAELCVSELAANAVRHGRSAFRLDLDVTVDRVRIGGTDHSNRLPRLRTPSLESDGGRGLHIIDVVADRWGTVLHPGDGKTVWFDLART